jgi:hypothetical protein
MIHLLNSIITYFIKSYTGVVFFHVFQNFQEAPWDENFFTRTITADYLAENQNISTLLKTQMPVVGSKIFMFNL